MIDFLDYFALALDISYVMFHLFHSKHKELLKNYIYNSFCRLIFSYEYIHITAEDVKKYGQTPAQMNTIINGAILILLS